MIDLTVIYRHGDYDTPRLGLLTPDKLVWRAYIKDNSASDECGFELGQVRMAEVTPRPLLP